MKRKCLFNVHIISDRYRTVHCIIIINDNRNVMNKLHGWESYLYMVFLQNA